MKVRIGLYYGYAAPRTELGRVVDTYFLPGSVFRTMKEEQPTIPVYSADALHVREEYRAEYGVIHDLEVERIGGAIAKMFGTFTPNENFPLDRLVEEPKLGDFSIRPVLRPEEPFPYTRGLERKIRTCVVAEIPFFILSQYSEVMPIDEAIEEIENAYRDTLPDS